jgi:hypothetical protein
LFHADIFSDLIQPGYLNKITILFICLNAFLTAVIFIYLRKKKRIHFIEKGIKKSIELWISKILLSEDEREPAYLQIPEKFQKHFRDKTKREFTVNQLIDIKKNLSGKIAENVIHLYEHLGFKQDSLVKFESNIWHRKVKGIHELYMMDQKNMIPLIYKYTNSDNQYVRMEAQAALIHFSGFEGLNFLDIADHPISEWEQLKILEQLKLVDFTEMKNLAKWLKSPNFSVVLFALKLADVYQEFHVHDDVSECLQHKDERVRAQAVVTLSRIANEYTSSILVQHYSNETFTNRQQILNCLMNIASDNEKDFLVIQLRDENNSLKLAAAKVIAKCCSNGWEMLKEIAKQQPHPYSEIYFHVKNELQ